MLGRRLQKRGMHKMLKVMLAVAVGVFVAGAILIGTN